MHVVIVKHYHCPVQLQHSFWDASLVLYEAHPHLESHLKVEDHADLHLILKQVGFDLTPSVDFYVHRHCRTILVGNAIWKYV